MLSGTTYPSISTVLPVQKLLLRHIRELVAVGDAPALSGPIRSIVAKLEQYESKAARQHIYHNATVLDPRLKLAHFADIGLDTESIRLDFELEAQKYRQGTAKLEPHSATDSAKPVNPFQQIFKKRRRETLGDEVDDYLSRAVEDGDVDPLTWWNDHSGSYPVLARMARTILSVPATSVPCERLFSTGRRVVTDFRGSLGARQMEALMCLQNWTHKGFL